MFMEELEKFRRELEIRNFSGKTVKTYMFFIEKFIDYAKDKELDENTVKNYMQVIIKNKDPSTVSSYLSAIKFFFHNVLKQEITIPYPRRNKHVPDVLTIKEMKRLIDVTANIKHRLIIKLMYGCGMRVSELTNLKKYDFDFDEKLIHIRLSKNRKDRFVKIPESLINELENYSKIGDDNAFFTSNRGGMLTTATIQKIVKTSARKAGIRKNVHPHTLRHSFATHLIQNGYAVTEVQPLLGHNSINTTMIYLHLASPNLLNIRSPFDSL